MGTTESILVEPSRQQQYPGPVQSPAQPARTSRRSRPSATHVTLHGIVIGLPSSGKRSLLRRLEGKDPFRDLDELSSRISIPYLAPGKTWGERINLVVDIPTNFDLEPDFCVILVNPRHDPKNIKTYIMKLLSMIIETRTRTICICILVNFRDQQEKSPPARLSEDDVKKWIQEAPFQLNSGDSSIIPMIVTGVTSMQNCYGLNALHHFIYQSYLHRKRLILEEQLEEVVQSSQESIESNPRTDYDEFMAIICPKNKQVPRENIRNTDVVVDRAAINSSQFAMPPSQTRRTFHSRTEKIDLPPKGLDTKKALDDFFADDESEDGVRGSATRLSKLGDDEDDFYYDDDGHRTVDKEDCKGTISPIPHHFVSNGKDGEEVAASSDTTLKKLSTPAAQAVIGKEDSDPRSSEVNGAATNEAEGEQCDAITSRTTFDEENGWDDDGLDFVDDDEGVANDAGDSEAMQAHTHGGANVKPNSEAMIPARDFLHPGNTKINDNHECTNDTIGNGAADSVSTVDTDKMNMTEKSTIQAETIENVERAEFQAIGDPHKSESDTKAMKTESVADENDRCDELATCNGRDVHERADDDDQCVIGDKVQGKSDDSNQDDSDDDEFFIAEDPTHDSPPRIENQAKGLVNLQPTVLRIYGDAHQTNSLDIAATPSISRSGGLSTAALAAIQHAEKEAQRMLETGASDQADDRAKRHKKKKKKRDSDETKRRK